MPQTLAAPAHAELLLRKSRFIACVQPVPDRAAAQAIVARLRAEHPGAAHVCWALMAGGQSAAVDDGEPGGTAGRPMLEVLRHHELEGVLATAVRYFGGIKLGAGGLVRAYTDCVAQALQAAQTVPLQRLRALRCSIPYDCEGGVRRALAAADAALDAVAHGPQVTLDFRVGADAVASLVERIQDLTQGRVQWAGDGPPDTVGKFCY